MSADAVRLLRALWPTSLGGWGEFRMMQSAGAALKPMFIPIPLKEAHLYAAFDWIVRENGKKNNAYFGVNPRITTRGRNEDVPAYSTLIADLDRPDTSWPMVLALAKAGAPASACVRTARGLHLYWFLKEPEATNSEARQRMQRLQIALDSDRVHDPARILRVPGTKCWKNDACPSDTYLAWIDESIRYTSKEVDTLVHELWPTVEIPAQPTAPPANPLLPVTGPPKDMNPVAWERYSAAWPKGSRSEVCLSFIQTAVLLGWNDERIRETLEKLPISQHYADRGPMGGYSFEYDLRKAREYLAKRLGTLDQVVIERASLFTNPPVDGIESSKIRVRLRPTGATGEALVPFDEWITIPNTKDPETYKRAWARWNAFVVATNFTGDPYAWDNVNNLMGKALQVEVKQNPDGRKRAVRFVSPINL